MKFRYSARTKKGELQAGFVEAMNREAAVNTLNSHELYILSMETVAPPRFYQALINFFNRVRRVDLMVFTQQFSVMMQAAIPLGDGLKALYRQTRNPILKEAVFEVGADVDSGLSLSQSLERQGHIFSDFYINLIRSAEVTGRVEQALTFLAEFLEKEIILLTKVRNALIYPVFVIVFFLLVAAVLMGVVFPQLEPIFRESNVPLPFITELFLAAGRFVAHWWLVLIAIVIVMIIVLIEYFRSDEGQMTKDQLLLGLPVLGGLLRKATVSRLTEGMSILVKGGIPVAQAIEIASHNVSSRIYQEALHEAADSIRRGELLSRALERSQDYFPPMVSQMIAVGESTGRLDQMLDRIAAFYTREVETTLNSLVELIQPVLMLVVGAFVGLLFASILLPIYNLVQVF